MVPRELKDKLITVIEENKRAKRKFKGLIRLKQMEKEKIVNGRSITLYCEKFNWKFKEKIRDKFNRTCVLCGITEEEVLKGQRKRGKQLHRLHVHHVNYDTECLCNDKKCECVPLCGGCHGKTHGGDKKYWEELLIDMLNTLNNIKEKELFNETMTTLIKINNIDI